MPTFGTYWDDDPEFGPPRFMTYEVQSVTGPQATHYISEGGYWRQKYNPASQLRAVSPHDDNEIHTGVCTTSGCQNVVSHGHKVCTKCRYKKRGRVVTKSCACGRPMYTESKNCRHCFTVGRRMGRMAGWA